MLSKFEFRGISSKTGRWYRGYITPKREVLGGEQIFCIYNETKDILTESIKETYVQILPETVGVFFGQKDMNGEKIFTGDKIEIFYQGVYREGVCAFSEETFRYIFVDEETGQEVPFSSVEQVLIMGTIFDDLQKKITDGRNKR